MLTHQTVHDAGVVTGTWLDNACLKRKLKVTVTNLQEYNTNEELIAALNSGRVGTLLWWTKCATFMLIQAKWGTYR